MNENTIPFHFESRTYQQPFIRAVNESIKGRSTIRYFYQIWARRLGKDKTGIGDCVPRRLIQDPCLVKMIYPTLVMGRQNLWDGIGKDGFRYRDHIPEGLRIGKPNDTTMKMSVQTKKYAQDGSTSIFQIAGSDNPDSLRGGNPRMLVFSEWAEQDPYAWNVVEPILKENDGIAIFNTTPKGNNHARALFEYAKTRPDLWYVSLITSEDAGIYSLQQLDEIRTDVIKRFASEGRSESEAVAYFEQEYMCSFKAPVVGSYYGEGMNRAERERRITNVPYVEGLPVHTAWDLGIDDSMSIWLFQVVGQEFHFIDYYENSGEGLLHYAQVLQKKGYLYGKHYAPHDIMVRELGSGKSRFEVAKGYGITFEAGPMLEIEDGINAGRIILSQCWFDKDKCYRGIESLKNYHKEWDEKNKVFKKKPKHDWSSHGADAFRRFAIGYRRIAPRGPSVNGHGGILPYMPGVG